MELFRGYVKTRGKKCTQKFANGEKLLTLEEAKKCDEYAGIINDGIILIDIDDRGQSDILMDMVEALNLNCRVYQTTRGRHFFFKNTSVKKCATGTKLAIGLTADIKLGDKNSYSILKFDKKERFIEWENENNVVQDLPAWLLPVKCDYDFLKMKKGDGRNQALFNYILTLQGFGLKKDDIKETLKLINTFIFQEPMKESELEVIMRDEAFKQDPQKTFFDKKGSFRFDIFAKFLMDQYHIIKINGQLHLYEGGVYVWGYNSIQSKMIEHISNLNKAKRSEVMAYLDLLIDKDSRLSGAEYIAFRNGVLNIYTDEFLDFSPDYIITNKINHDYNPKAYYKKADTVLNNLACGNKNIRSLLEEVIGYTFFRRNELRKAFILIGDKHNGKSTYLNMIGDLLGEENICSLDLKELGDRFKTAELFGKLANIGDDIGDEFISDSSIFKKVVSGDRVNAERKGQDPFDFACYSKQLFSANSIPRIKDKSGAVIDRLIIVPFNASFSKDDPNYDPFIKTELQTEEAMEYLINVGVEGLRRVLDEKQFTVCESVKESIKEYEENNNPILLFFKDLSETAIYDRPSAEVYDNYMEFCIRNGLTKMSRIEFTKIVKKKYGCESVPKTVNGSTQRVFVKK